MWHHNKKNPMEANKPKAPSKPALVNASAKPSKQTATIKVGSPEIRVGLDGAMKRSNMIGEDMMKPKMPKKVTMPGKKIRTPKVIKPKV